MRSPLLLLVLLVGGLMMQTAAGSRLAPRRAPVAAGRETPSAPPLFFEENRGQAPTAIRYLTRAGGVRAGITEDGALITMLDHASPRPVGSLPPSPNAASSAPGESHPEPACVRMELAGRRPQARVRGSGDLPTIVSYFRGSDPARWLTGIPAYRAVRCEKVYPGVDLLCYGTGPRVEYDLVVAPGADPSAIRLRFSGQESVRIDYHGRLCLRAGGQELIHERPVAYQPVEGARRPVTGDYVLLAKNEVGFRLGAYDRGMELVIDPVVTYLSYLGGSGSDGIYDGLSAARDAQGNLYIGGATSSLNFPVVGAYQGTNHGGTYEGADAFVAKLSPDGSQLLYATYLGGAESPFSSGDEWKVSVAVDAAGSAVLAGATPSPTFPLTPGAFRTTFGGGFEGFVSRLSPAGSTLVSSTFIGGNQRDWPTDVTLDAAGNAVVVGLTESGDFFTSPTAVQRVYRGFFDAFLTKVSPNGTAVPVSTLLGGTSYDHAIGVAVDAAQNLYVTGFTSSANYPTAFAVQAAHHGGFPSGFDAMVTKLNPTASAFVYSTFLGGNLDDASIGLTVSAAGQATVTGRTESFNFPTTATAYQRNNAGGNDVFVTRLTANGAALAFSTLIGAPGSDIGTTVALGSQGETYVAGFTTSETFPTMRPVQASKHAGTDSFVAILSDQGTSLTFSTYLGGAGEDLIWTVLADPDGQISVVGYTTSTDLPATAAYQSTSAGATDLFIARLLISGPAPPTNLQVAADGTPSVSLSWEDRSSDETGFEIERSIGSGNFAPLATVAAEETSYLDTQVAVSKTYTYRVRATGASEPSAYSNTAQVTIPLGVPAAPAGLMVTAVTEDFIDLGWEDHSANETEFRIERDAGLGFLSAGTAAPNATSFRDEAVLPNSTYHYRVLAANAAGASVPSNTVTATTPARIPTAPTNLRATVVGGTRVDLQWEDASDNENGFRIVRSGVVGTGVEIGTVGANVTTFSDTTAVPDSTYFYRVRAFNTAGSSASTSVLVQIPPLPPNPPAGVQVQAITGYRLRVSWTDQSTNEASFTILRREGAGDFSPRTTLPANTTSYLDLLVQPNTTYTYQVQAVNGGGSSVAVNSAAVTTPPPGKLTITPPQINFGAVRIGRSARKVLTFKNTGSGPVQYTVDQASLSFGFESPGDVILAPGAKKQLAVRFSPTSKGRVFGALLITSEGLGFPVPMQGKGR